VFYHGLDIEQLGADVDIQIQVQAKRLAARLMVLEVTREARDWLAIGGFDPQYGARPLRRLVQSAIGDQLAKELLAGRIRDGHTVLVDVNDDDPGALIVRPVETREGLPLTV
jgi:ATP-dependent Clp protease ATP-binding subunit ClpB